MVSEGYVKSIADKEEKYAKAHLYKLFLLFLKVSKTPKYVPRKIATPTIEIRLPV